MKTTTHYVNKKEENILFSVQTQHEWVHKDISKLAPSNLSGKVLKKKAFLKSLK